MRSIVSSVVALSLMAALAGHADAASRQQKKRLKASHQSSAHAAKTRATRKPASGEAELDYYEHILDKVPLGSKRWWSIYDEQHGVPD